MSAQHAQHGTLDTLVLASGNAGKLAELADMLEPLGIAVKSQAEFDVIPPEETGSTFFENALIKAEGVAAQTGLPALADDSGLEVEALGGAPGVHSARFSGVHGDDQANNDLLLEKLDGCTDRNAQFRCVVALAWPPGSEQSTMIAQGKWQGTIMDAPRGENGFGYDPLFMPAGSNCTSAELPTALKNQSSHRGQAMRTMVEKISGLLDAD